MARALAWLLCAQLVGANQTHRLPCGSFDLKENAQLLRSHGKKYNASTHVPCSEKCPFFSFESASQCRGLCLTQEGCIHKAKNHLAGYPNITNGRCEGCAVPGCESCLKDKSICTKCFSGLKRTEDGTCTLYFLQVFQAGLSVGLLVVVLFIIYVISLAFRKGRNVKTLNEAMVARELSKLRDESRGMKRLPLTTSMVDEPHSGRGTLLYFRHMMAILVWSVVTTVSLGCLTAAYNIFQPPPAHSHASELCYREAMGVKSAGEDEAYLNRVRDRENAEQAMFWFTLVLYVVSTLGGVAFALWQRLAFRNLDTDSTAMQDFALVAKGFPIEHDNGAQTAEKEYHAFFEGVLRRPIVGVSVCWNFHTEPSAVEKFMDDELAVLEWGSDYKDKPDKEKRPFLASVDDWLLYFLGASDNGGEDKDGESSPASTPGSPGTTMATRFPTSGYTIVVLHNKDDMDHALRVFGAIDELSEPSSSSEESSDEMQDTGWPPLVAVYEPWPQLSSPTWVPHGARGLSQSPHFPQGRPLMRHSQVHAARKSQRHGAGQQRHHLFRQRHKITVQKPPCGPGEICWESYGKRSDQVMRDVGLGILSVLLFMGLWALAFYGPYAYFVMFSSTIPGAAGRLAGSLLGTTLGFVITLGNQVMYRVIAAVSARAGFHYSTMADNFNMSLYCVAVFVNTLLDLLTTHSLAHGEKLDAKFQQSEAINMRSLAAVPSAQEAFAKQLWAYLFPGTIFGPFFMEPILGWLSFKVAAWIVRSRSSIGRQKAEAILDLAKFDFSRYADNVINVMLCICFLFFTASVLFLSFFALVASIFYIYLWDSYRVLRNTKEQEMDLDSTDNTAHFLNVLPCSLLAVCLVYRCYKLEILGLTSERTGLVPWIMFHVAVAHWVVHSGLIMLIHRVFANSTEEEDNPDDTYKELAQGEALNWFNANPIHCLRSKYVLGENPPCIYCVKGKEKLQMVNEACGYYFDGPALAKKIDEETVLKEAAETDAVALIDKQLREFSPQRSQRRSTIQTGGQRAPPPRAKAQRSRPAKKPVRTRQEL